MYGYALESMNWIGWQTSNRILKAHKMYEQWRSSIMIPVYKNKWNALSLGNYRGIKLVSYIIKILDTVLEIQII